MMFKADAKLYDYIIEREGGVDVLYINYFGAPYVPSLADSPLCMARTIDALIDSPHVSRIVFVQQKNYNYNFFQTSLLIEIAQLYNYLLKQEKVLSTEKLVPFSCKQCLSKRYDIMNYLVLNLLKQDPLACYIEAKRLLREERLSAKKMPKNCLTCENDFIRDLNNIVTLLEKTKLIRLLSEKLESYHLGDRTVYAQMFRVNISPNFSFTRIISSFPENSDIISQYEISSGYDKSTVTILKMPNRTKYFYHLMPPEYSVSEEEYSLLNLARNVLIEHRPKAEEFTDPERTRGVFYNIARDLLQELAGSKNTQLSYKTLNQLATILVRYTIGFGIIEILLQDEKIQDISVNAPPGVSPIFVRQQDFDECDTNITVDAEDVNSWAAKFRMTSGRPLDEANPILDTDLVVGKMRARIAIIQQPLSPDGIAYAFRRHRDAPWTLPLFIKNKMLNPLAAGLLSFLIDGSRTLLVAGTRSAGKTSLLGSLMLEIMSKYRIIVVEDTLELPVDALRKLDFDILRMKVRSALLKESTEISTDEGIRTSLRLGDSSLIVGEVRSVEAKALYEAMRVGALANVVAGTIHGASAYGVFDRVVNDLQVPITSFKATDIIAVVNPIKTPDGLHSWRRMTALTEVRKHWTHDPLEEKGFVDLLKYNVEKDELEPTPDLIAGESEILKAVASNVKGWAGNWDAIWDNITLRAKIKEELVLTSEKLKMPELLEAEFNTKSNNAFHEISDKIVKEVGLPESKRVLSEWREWLGKEIKRKVI